MLSFVAWQSRNKYANNRHNIGFMAVDQITAAPLSLWRNKFRAELSDGVLDGEKVILLKTPNVHEPICAPVGAMRLLN